MVAEIYCFVTKLLAGCEKVIFEYSVTLCVYLLLLFELFNLCVFE